MTYFLNNSWYPWYSNWYKNWYKNWYTNWCTNWYTNRYTKKERKKERKNWQNLKNINLWVLNMDPRDGSASKKRDSKSRLDKPRVTGAYKYFLYCPFLWVHAYWRGNSHLLGGCSLSNLYPISTTPWPWHEKLLHIKRNGRART